MQLFQMEYFVAIADCKSMNKAAEQLFVTQSSLSKTIKNLEAELGFPLLNRSRRGVTMTELGKEFYDHARMILEQTEMINSLSRQDQPRTFSVAAYPFFAVSRLYGEFLYEHQPCWDLSFRFIQCRLKEVMERVEEGSADIGVVVYNSEQYQDLRHMLRYKELELTVVAEDTWYVSVGPKSPLYDRKEVLFRDLTAYSPVRMPDDYFSNVTAHLEVDGTKVHEIMDTIYVNDSAAILSILRSSTAFYLGPGFSRQDLEGYGIRSIPIHNCQVVVYVGWIHKKNKGLSEEEKAFVQKLGQLGNLS